MADSLITEVQEETARDTVPPTVTDAGGKYRIVRVEEVTSPDPRTITQSFYLERKSRKDRLGNRGWRGADVESDSADALSELISAGVLGV